MDVPFDETWANRLCRVCDPVFEAADVGFVRRVSGEQGVVTSLLWEADPQRFADRYPDSGIVE